MIAEIPKVKVWALLTAALGSRPLELRDVPICDARKIDAPPARMPKSEPLEPAAVRAGLDLGHQALAIGVQVGAVEGALEEPLAGVAAEQDAGGDA